MRRAFLRRRRTLAGIFLFLALEPWAFAQFSWQVGVKGGIPLTDALVTSSRFLSIDQLRPSDIFFSNTKRYTVGPSVELGLPRRLAVEFDALYKRLDYNGMVVASVGPNQFGTRIQTIGTANSWEFPLLLKARSAGRQLKIFGDLGVSFHRVSASAQVTNFVFSTGTTTITKTGSPAELRDPFNAGFVLGGGLEFRVPFLRISPEVRYTHWGSKNFQESNGLLRTNWNQADFLLGITF